MTRWLGAWLCVWLVPAAVGAQEPPPAGPSTGEPPGSGQPGAPQLPEVPVPHEEAAAPVPPAATPAGPVTAILQTPEQLAAQTGWSVSAGLDHTFEHALLTPGGQWLGAAVASLGLEPRFNFRGPAGMRLVAAASASLSFEYTPPNNGTGRRFDWSDLRVGLSAPAALREPTTRVVVTPSLSLTLPTSLRSLWAGNLAVLGAGLNVSRSVGKWQLNYLLSGSRGFHRTQAIGPRAPAPGEPLRRDAAGRPFYLFRSGAQMSDGLGLNTAWMLGNRVSALFLPSDSVFVSGSAGLSHSWAYDGAPDDTSGRAPTTNLDGEPVVRPGMGRRDRLSLSLGAGYNLTSTLSLSFGVEHLGWPLNGTQRGLRFLDPASWLDSLSYSLSLSALY